MAKLSNLEIKKSEGKIIVKINPKIYPLDVVYSAAYVFLDKAYVLIDGDPKKEIIVELKPKDGKSIDKLGDEFNNELLNYANYKKFSEKNKDIRTMIVQRAIVTNDPEIITEKSDDDDLDEETKKLLKELEQEDDDFLDDPQGIAIPWEEKYGKKSKKRK